MKKAFSVGGAILLILVLGFTGYKIYDYMTFRNEKSAFVKIDKDINAVLGAVENDLAVSTTQENKYCSNDQEKYGGGQFRCQISTHIIIETNEDNITSSLSAFTKALEANNFSEKVALKNVGQASRGQYNHSPTQTDCYPSYKFITNSRSTKELDIDFYCTRPVRRAVFPQ